MVDEVAVGGKNGALRRDMNLGLADQLMFRIAQGSTGVGEILDVLTDHVRGGLGVAVDQKKVHTVRVEFRAVTADFRRVTVGNGTFGVHEKKDLDPAIPGVKRVYRSAIEVEEIRERRFNSFKSGGACSELVASLAPRRRLGRKANIEAAQPRLRGFAQGRPFPFPGSILSQYAPDQTNVRRNY